MIKDNLIANAEISYETIMIYSINFQQKNKKEVIPIDIFKGTVGYFNKQLKEKDICLRYIEIEYPYTVNLYFDKNVIDKINENELLDACANLIEEYLGMPRVEAQSFKIQYFEKLKSLQYFIDKTNLIEKQKPRNLKEELIKKNLVD